jgi:hypothetical protein
MGHTPVGNGAKVQTCELAKSILPELAVHQPFKILF